MESFILLSVVQRAIPYMKFGYTNTIFKGITSDMLPILGTCAILLTDAHGKSLNDEFLVTHSGLSILDEGNYHFHFVLFKLL